MPNWIRGLRIHSLNCTKGSGICKSDFGIGGISAEDLLIGSNILDIFEYFLMVGVVSGEWLIFVERSD
jgi:hypothetical protein